MSDPALGEHSPSDPRLLVVCKGDATLATLEGRSLTVVQRTSLTDVGHEVVAAPDGRRAFVPLYGTGGVGRPGRPGDGIDVVDLAGGVVERTIPLPRGTRPHDAAWGPGGLLLVTAEGLSSVLAVDCGTGRVVGAYPTRHPQAHMLALTRDGEHACTANVRPGSLTKVSLSGHLPPHTLDLSTHVNRVSVSPLDPVAYVADQARPRLAVVDLVAMTVTAWLGLPDVAFGTAPTPDGRHLVLALRRAGRLALLDLGTGSVVGDVRVPVGPQGVVLDEPGHTAFTACSPADVVVAVDLRSMSVVAEVRPGPAADGVSLAPCAV